MGFWRDYDHQGVQSRGFREYIPAKRELLLRQATTFNPLEVTRELEAAGIERRQAEAIAEGMRQAATAELAELATKADLAGLEARMYRALWIQGGAIVAILTALRFLPA